MNVSWMQPQYRETEDWIIESFHVGSGPTSPFTTPVSLLLIGVSVGGLSAIAAAVFVWWRRRGRSRLRRTDRTRQRPGAQVAGYWTLRDCGSHRTQAKEGVMPN